MPYQSSEKRHSHSLRYYTSLAHKTRPYGRSYTISADARRPFHYVTVFRESERAEFHPEWQMSERKQDAQLCKRMNALTPEQRSLALIGYVIKQRRKEQGITQRRMASEIGVGERTIRSLESGAGTVTIARLLEVLQRLGIDITLCVRSPWPPETHDASDGAVGASADTERGSLERKIDVSDWNPYPLRVAERRGNYSEPGKRRCTCEHIVDEAGVILGVHKACRGPHPCIEGFKMYPWSQL